MRTDIALRLVPLAALALIATGCAYVGQSSFEDKQSSLDQDNDGALLGGNNKDCDDKNDNKTPGAAEIPSDGWDNDCLAGDVVDVDGDGYAGISREVYLELTPDAVWPTDVDPDQVDCMDDPAQHERAADIHPGATDSPYDGIDANCLGDNDFDVDGDGYLPDTFQLGTEPAVDTRIAFDAYVLEWGLDLPNPSYGDCDDFDELVHPGVPVEDDEWYDGIDQNCDGNNDFDQDGDEFMPGEEQYAIAFDDFVGAFHNGVSPFPVQWGDCLDAPDEDDQGRDFAVPAEVYPGNVADEVPYDGVDSDCGQDNDFDQDGDGFMPDSASLPGNLNGATFDGYASAWGYVFADPVYGDCDDTDPDVWPGALEILGDGVDRDCSGEAQDSENITPFGFDGMTWDNPRPPKLAATNSHYILATAAEQIDFGAVQSDVGVAVVFAQDSGADAARLGAPVLWQGNTNPQPLGAAVDVVADGDTFWASTSYTHYTNPGSYLMVRRVQWDVQAAAYLMIALDYAFTGVTYDSLDVDLVLDSAGDPWAVSCGLDTLQSLKGTGAFPAPADDLSALSGGLCFWESEPDPVADLGLLTLCAPDVNCESYDYDPVSESLALSASQPSSGGQYTAVDYRDGWLNAITPGGGATLIGPTDSHLVLQDATVLSIDADWRDTTGDLVEDTLYIAAVIDRGAGNEVVMVYGDPDVALTEIALPYEDVTRPGLIPEAAAILTDNNRLFLAVSGSNPSTPTEDAVGWIFLGWD